MPSSATPPKSTTREPGPHRLADGEIGCSLHGTGLGAGPIGKVKGNAICREPNQEPRHKQVRECVTMRCDELHKGTKFSQDPFSHGYHP